MTVELSDKDNLKHYAWLSEGEKLGMLSQKGKDYLKLYRMYHPNMDENELRAKYYRTY